MALQRLLLGGEKEALLTELVRQKLQLRDLLRGEFSGPWAAGDLPDVGVDMVYGGMRIYLLPGYSGVDRGLFDQLAEISCDRQSGDGQIAAQPLVLLLRHADGQGTAIVPHRWAWLVFIPHRGSHTASSSTSIHRFIVGTRWSQYRSSF